jgi:hypothetical protein
MKRMMFSFDSEEKKDDFSRWLTKAAAKLDKSHPWRAIINTAIAADTDAPYSEPIVYLFVSGQEMASGLQDELIVRFENEVAAHSATVELREKIGDKWKTIRQRKNQF